MDSEIWHTWDVIGAIRLASKRSLAHQWNRSTAVRRLRGHCISTNHDAGRAHVQENESKPADDLHNKQSNLALWLVLGVAMFINLGMLGFAFHDECAQGNEEHHEELDENGPGGHIHAILSVALRGTSLIRQHQRQHTCGDKEDRKHGAECN